MFPPFLKDRGRKVYCMSTPPFARKLWLSSPTMHGEEMAYVREAYETNWMSTVGQNIDALERLCAEYVGVRHAVALSSGTAALHLCLKLAGLRPGEHVLCADLTFAATVNPILYEGGIPVLLDSERGTWNMSPAALRRAFAAYPAARIVIAVNLYGTPADLFALRDTCDAHGALLIEDAAESLGATCQGRQTGSFGHFAALSFNGNKIITGSSGGMLLTDDAAAAAQARKWSTQSREDAPWYQHREIGYNYRMSNLIAGVARGQFPYLGEHIARKKEIYERYREGFADLPVAMNPYHSRASEPNFWLSCLLIEEKSLCREERTETRATYRKEKGKSCPAEILSALAAHGAEARPIWKPMHRQPIFRQYPFVTEEEQPVSDDVFRRGLCLPSDIKMTAAEQDKVIEIVKSCFA